MQNNNKKFGKKNFSGNKKGNNKFQSRKPKHIYEGFKNRIKLKRVDPSGYTEEFLEDFYEYFKDSPFAKYFHIEEDFPNRREVINFRKHLLNGYHIYKILVSAENHFIGGYTYRHMGWVVGHSEQHSKDIMNMTLILDKSLVGDVDSNLHNIIFFKAMVLASELFMKSGKIIRTTIRKDIYDSQKKYLSKAWVVDEDQTFTGPLGDTFNFKEDSNLNYVVLKNSSYSIPLKVGNKIDLALLDYLQITGNCDKLSAINPIPSVGVELYAKIPSTISGEDGHRIFASITKCNKEREIHFRCSENDADEVENLIKIGICFENSFYKHTYYKYNDPSEIKIIRDGDLLPKKQKDSQSDNK